MLSRLVLFVALALICVATAFPLSELFVVTPNSTGIFAEQLLSLRDGTYLVLISSGVPLAPRALNPRVRTIPLGSQSSVATGFPTEFVVRIHPTNNSVIWAYASNEFGNGPYAVVDDARSIFVVSDLRGTSFDFISGFRVLRFSVDGEIIWKEVYTNKEFGRPIGEITFTGINEGIPYVDLAGPRTLAILGAASYNAAESGRNAVFVDTITRKARVARFPLPDRPLEYFGAAAVAADPASDAACFADFTSLQFAPLTGRLFVQCVNVEGGGEVVSRVLVPFQATNTSTSQRMIMAGGGEGKAAVLYVVATRTIIVDETSMPPEKSANVEEILLFKLDPATLQDVEWETGLISTKPTMRKLLLTTAFSGSENRVNSLEYIPDRNTLVVLFETLIILSGIETLPDGTIAFLGNSSKAAERIPTRKWLLFFGNDPEPAAVRIPDDPRPDGEQDDFDYLDVVDIELSEDGRTVYLFGGLETFSGFGFGGFRYKELITVPFPIPEFVQPGAGSLEMEGGLGDVVDESFEPSPTETAEAITDEEVEPSPNALLEKDT